MASALIISGIVLLWYCMKAVKANPEKPDWNKAIIATLFWPLSLFFNDTGIFVKESLTINLCNVGRFCNLELGNMVFIFY